MVVLDTDHSAWLIFPNRRSRRGSQTRLGSMDIRQITTTIVTYEEQTRGWLADDRSGEECFPGDRGVPSTQQESEDFRTIDVLDFDEEAAAELQRLRRMKLRIGTMDLKIAAITLVHDATLLSRNLRDFKKVPGLKVEDWTS